MQQSCGFDRVAFARRFSRLRGGCPQKYWARRFGLSYAAVKDMEQGRVNPSRAVVLLITAIELSPGFMQDVAKLAKADLARIIHESSYQGFADPALRFDDRGGRQFPVAQVTARFRVFAGLRGWA